MSLNFKHNPSDISSQFLLKLCKMLRKPCKLRNCHSKCENRKKMFNFKSTLNFPIRLICHMSRDHWKCDTGNSPTDSSQIQTPVHRSYPPRTLSDSSLDQYVPRNCLFIRVRSHTLFLCSEITDNLMKFCTLPFN